MKNSSDTMGNRACDLPTCSAVPQPTALRRAPSFGEIVPENTLKKRELFFFQILLPTHVDQGIACHMPDDSLNVILFILSDISLYRFPQFCCILPQGHLDLFLCASFISSIFPILIHHSALALFCTANTLKTNRQGTSTRNL